jgi:alpha-ketoglutarate-dependent taurine dioxygenase
VKGESLDEKGQKALDVLTSVVEDPKNWLEFSLERGQIEIANNRETGHARSGYHDDPSKPRRRLERLWLRDEGRRTYLG